VARVAPGACPIPPCGGAAGARARAVVGWTMAANLQSGNVDSIPLSQARVQGNRRNAIGGELSGQGKGQTVIRRLRHAVSDTVFSTV
jgi:hypothetical protein